MVPDQTDDLVAIDVEFSTEVLEEIDRLAVLHGYETPSAVVQEAIEEHSQ